MFLGSFYFKVIQGHRMEAKVRRQDIMKLSIYWHDLHVCNRVDVQRAQSVSTPLMRWNMSFRGAGRPQLTDHFKNRAAC